MGLGCVAVSAGHMPRGINNQPGHQQFSKIDRVSLEGYTQAWQYTGRHVARQLADLRQACLLRDTQKLLAERGRVCTAGGSDATRYPEAPL